MTKASSRSASAARPPSATEIESPSPLDRRSSGRPSASRRWTVSTAPALVTSSRPPTGDGELGDHVVTLGDDRLPGVGATAQHVGIEGDADDPAARRIEVGDADERPPVGGDENERRGVDPADHVDPAVVSAIEDVDVGAPVADLDVDDEPAAVRRERDVRPRLRVGTVVPHHRVVAPVGAEAMVVDGAVVLVARRDSGCRRTRIRPAPRPPSTPACPGCGRRRRRPATRRCRR